MSIDTSTPLSRDWAAAVTRELAWLRKIVGGANTVAGHDAAGLRLAPVAVETLALFELTASLAAGSQATARRLVFQGTSWTAASGPTTEVYDSLGDKSGGLGDRCWCYFSPRSGRWEVVQLECG
ncbi:MAG: hypothetical protein K1X74_00535 [Pirellulales bacterium]|nr:hypothetical protein [Pirellulales bacterium]